MIDPIIAVENLGKRYRIRLQQHAPRYVALRDIMTSKLTSPLRWGRSTSQSGVRDCEDFWALRNVSFDISEGEVVGIIGRNGAGKSTLLKVLSRITEPTEGRVTLGGRVASLLEVGTGFHPELSGRENIFLNGAILGMSRAEIGRKFDEIVAFAEIETFLDTPVKHYSSGMYVRLAFAVAAHLEPEILIVDEVLAVGDADFQRKCLGKMHEVSTGGRTVLFVSHNMSAISSLTSRSVVLDVGRIVFDGSSAAAIERYTQVSSHLTTTKLDIGRGLHTSILSVALLDESGRLITHYTAGKPLRLAISFETDGAPRLSLDAFLRDATRQKLAMASMHHFNGLCLPETVGRFHVVLEMPPLWLASGTYSFDVTTALPGVTWDHYVEDAIEFDVVLCNPGHRSWNFDQRMGYGSLALQLVCPPQFLREPND